MHPNKKFSWIDRDEMLLFAEQRGLATIIGSDDGTVLIAHAPVTIHRDPDRVQFHLAVTNRLGKAISGQRVVMNSMAMDGYISPDWYMSENQVPTWNYLSVEIEGVVRDLSDAELRAQIDDLSAVHEGTIRDKMPWTTAKMASTALNAMLNGIRGFELLVEDVRGTAKLSQNKDAADFSGAVEGLADYNPGLAATMKQWRFRA
jgi:transcriptional regulator